MHDMRRLISLCEHTNIDLSFIKQIADEYRAHIEAEGYEHLRAQIGMIGPEKEKYRRFTGLCNVASRKLAEIYRDHGFPATTRMFEYHGSDAAYWHVHGGTFYDTQEQFDDADTWEFGEDHEVVLIDNNVIVDVTSDQFNVTDPDSHRVVVTRVGDRRYR